MRSPNEGEARVGVEEYSFHRYELCSTPQVSPPLRSKTLAVWPTLTPILVLFAVGVGAYHNSLSGPFVLDDIPAIVDNPSLRAPWSVSELLLPAVDGGVTVSGRPVTNLSLALNQLLLGREAWGYHVGNFLIHLGAGLVLFYLTRRTLLLPPLAARFGVAAYPLALTMTCLWLLHPLQTESVTYIIQRAESLMGLFYLLTLYAFIRGVSAVKGGHWLVVSGAACLLGMATKEVMVSAPLIVLLYDRTFVAGTFREAWRQRRTYYLGVGCTWLVLAGLVAGAQGRGGSAGFSTEISAWEYALTQCQAVVHYLRLVIWPAPLVFDYGTGTVNNLMQVWPQALLLLGLVGATGWALGRWPAWGFMGVSFFAILAPSSSIVPVATQTMAEHRLYLPLVIPVGLIVIGLYKLLGRWSYPVCGLLALGCGWLTLQRNEDYRTAERLWADTVAKRPANPRAHHNLGLAELDRGNLAAAARHLGEAIALAPETADSHYSLGLILTRQGHIARAMASYQLAIVHEPRHAAAHNNLANLLFTTGQTVEAGRHYAEAVRLEPNFAAARNSYGNWLLEEGRMAEALTQCKAAIKLKPSLSEAYFNAGNASLALGRLAEAFAFFAEAVRVKPDFAAAHNNLANLLLERDEVARAMEHYVEAVRLEADYIEPRRSLALLLLHQGRSAEARSHLEVLAKSRSGDPEITQALERARAATK